MNSKELIEATIALYHMRRPGMIWGPPGIGKTDNIVQAGQAIAEELVKDKKSGLKKVEDFQVKDFRVALRDPTDFKGFPVPDTAAGVMKFLRDGELPHDGHGILFFDELVSGTPATQAAAMQLTLKNHHGKFAIGDYELPPGWGIMAAGNRETDRGVVHRMPTPLANRFIHLDAEVDPKAWVGWALENNISAELIAFIRFKEELLFKFDPKLDSKAFPTPRSWVATEDIVNSRASKGVQYGMVKGTVGEGPGSEYWGFRDLINELPTLEQIRLDPKGCPLPKENKPSARFAITTLMGANVSETTFESFLEYSSRMDPEFQTVFIKDALIRDPKLRTNRIYAKWVLKNADVIM